MSPESIIERKYSVASDVWSFGVLCWEVLSFGKAPFHDMSAEEAVIAVLSGRRLERPDICSKSMFVDQICIGI